MKHNLQKGSKTLGPQAARLFVELNEREQMYFSYKDVVDIADLQLNSARTFVASLVKRGLVSRLKPGLFALIPFELGKINEYMGNPFLVARELVNHCESYISHASAMSLHQMTTQPQFVFYATSPRPVRGRVVLGVEFRFVCCKAEHLFGTEERWVTKAQRVRVSDVERTILDGLKHPQHCGGVTEVAKGFWMRRADVDAYKLVDYALRLGIGAVFRRLGFLLDLFEVGALDLRERLREELTSTYALLEPMLPNEGRHMSRWKLRLNVSPEEIEGIVRT